MNRIYTYGKPVLLSGITSFGKLKFAYLSDSGNRRFVYRYSDCRTEVRMGSFTEYDDSIYGRFVCYRISYISSIFCMHYGIELCAWYYGKSCTTDEYVFCWYAIESPGWIYCIVFNSLFASKCCRLYFFRNQNDGEVNCRRYVLMKTC